MLFAKVAMGCCATLGLAGAYTFHQGILSVQEESANGRHVHVWIPAALAPMALHFVPREPLRHATWEVAPMVPAMHALAKALEKFPEAEFVEVRDTNQHVRVRTHNGKLLIDVSSPDENVHVTCPLATLEDVLEQLQETVPAV